MVEKIKRARSEKIVFIIAFIVFFVYAISLMLPFTWMIVNSFKDSAEYTIGISLKKAFALPSVWKWDNYVDVMGMIKDGDTTYVGMFFNSVWTTVLPCFLGTFMPMLTGYIFAKYNFKGREFLYAVIIFSMTIPIIGSNGVYYQLIAKMGLFDNPLFLVVTNLGGLGGFGFMVFYGFFKNISWSYAEAVFIDGGNDYTVLFKIMIPQAFPMMMMLFISGFIGGWNNYETFIMYMPSYPTIASGMYSVENTLSRTGRMPIYFAGLVVSMIPVLTLFVIFSDKMLTSVTIGGLKG